MLWHMPIQTQFSRAPRKVALFRNGRNQAVRIPRELELAGDQALLYRDGNRLIVEEIEPQPALLELLDSLKPIEDASPDVDTGLPGPDDIRL
jgi:antitoxin VapB